jgi:hypothetical protein
MKNATLFLLLSCSLMVSAQQTPISGVVSIHNSQFKTGTRQYVQNAQVEDDFGKANAQITDATGKFTLIFVEKDKGKSVVLSIKKAGLQVVNTPDLTAVAGQTDALKISMAHPDSIAEYRKRLYNIGKSEAEKNLYAQLKKKGAAIEALQKDAQKNAAAIEKLQKEYGELDKYAKNIEEQAQDLARRYAPINLDDAAPLYREAFGYFQQGDLEKAMQILRGADLIGQADKMIEKEAKAKNKLKEGEQELADVKEKKPELIQALRLKSDLHKARFEWDSVITTFETIRNLNPRNIEILHDFARILSRTNNTQRSIGIYQEALKVSTEKNDTFSIAITLDYLGNVVRNFRNCDRIRNAVSYQIKAVSLLESFTKNRPNLLLDLAICYDNLGGTMILQAAWLDLPGGYRVLCDNISQNVVDSIFDLHHKIIDSLNKKSLVDFKTLSNLYKRLAYQKKAKDFAGADSLMRKSLRYLEIAAKPDKSTFESEIGVALYNYACFHKKQTPMFSLPLDFQTRYLSTDIIKIDSVFKLAMYYLIIASNKQIYLKPILGESYYEYAIFLFSIGKPVKSEQYLTYAYNHFLKLYEKDSSSNNKLGLHKSFFALAGIKNMKSDEENKIFQDNPNIYTYALILNDSLNDSLWLDPFFAVKWHKENSKYFQGVEHTGTTFNASFMKAVSNQIYGFLFIKSFTQSEKIARWAVNFFQLNSRIKAFLAYSLLFQKKDDEAKKILDELKIKYAKANYDKKILRDLDRFSFLKFDKDQIDKAIKWVKE